ncbi:RING-H2 finger protein ATL39-like [Malania oleifera]|uniref:RING-H2 finger protein ATL39-like n=1 Tax=Malania oleifera TaxID=397392 RepID=UPI0025AEA5F8|nr:RING-H2 finger protein ATL39-like [Malania oleifera]
MPSFTPSSAPPLLPPPLPPPTKTRMGSTQNPQPVRWEFTEAIYGFGQFQGHGFILVLAFFFLVFLLTLLFLYLHWVCRSRTHLPVTAAAVVFPSEARSSAALPAAPSLGLDAASIGRLPVLVHCSAKGCGGGGGSTECCICLSVFQEEEKVKVLPGCHHAFHVNCVDKWLSSHSSCPLCRAPISPLHHALEID